MRDVAGISQIGSQKRGGRAQAVTCVQLLSAVAGSGPTLVIAQSIYHSVGCFRSRCRRQIVQLLEAQPDGERQRRGKYKGGAGLIVQSGTIGSSAKGRGSGSAVE